MLFRSTATTEIYTVPYTLSLTTLFRSLVAAQPTRGLDVGAIEFVWRQILDQKPEISKLERGYRENHIQRLRDGYRETIDTSEIHLDVLTNLKRINSHITAIAYPILGT